ncbi:Terpene cyclase [Mycena venus]|uniref:Terpene synthase n=1 Tax=Mycena venus TaxID=2733690 RepID=A0A8H6Z4U7_9AGAR|nr:Terpene cyclase [Mycena venus]
MLAKDRESIRLLFPDTLCKWPWPRHLNPHFEVCKDESAAWLETFNAFSPKAQTASNRCDFNLLASLAYPLLDKDGCRGCDLMNLFFLIDEHFDKSDTNGARVQADIVMHALRNPNMVRPHGEWIGGEVARQFWLNAIRIATPTSQRRFIDEFHVYMDSMVQKAQDRTEDHIRGIDEYFEVRRVTIGVKAAIFINEIRMNIPDEVLRNEHIETLISASTDMILIANDLYSYNVEDPQLDHQVTELIHGLGNWVRGYDVWSFESERYFGKRGKEIQMTRTVELLPKVVVGPETVAPEIFVSEN